MQRIGLGRFAAITSDSTGNTKLARELTIKQAPFILNLPDPVHHTANTIRNIVQMDHFEEVHISTVLTYSDGLMLQ
jgi:hypothetical protein